MIHQREYDSEVHLEMKGGRPDWLSEVHSLSHGGSEAHWQGCCDESVLHRQSTRIPAPTWMSTAQTALLWFTVPINLKITLGPPCDHTVLVVTASD